MTPKFSIIIPVYNVAPYLRECLDSVLTQTFTDWEAICVDDGSTDESGAILDAYAVRDRRMRIIHQKNGGVSTARNVALNIARGEYVGFLDGDDVIAPYLLEKVLEVARQIKHVDYISYDIHFGDVNGVVDWSCSSDGITSYEGVENAISARALMLVRFAGTCGGYYRREMIGNIRFNSSLVAREDTLFHLELLSRLKMVAGIGCPCYFYRSGRPGNSSSRRRVSQSLAFYRALDGLLAGALGMVVDEYLEVRRSIKKVIARDFSFSMAGEMDLDHCERLHYRSEIKRYRDQDLFDLNDLSRLDRISAILIIFFGMYHQLPLFKVLRSGYKKFQRRTGV